MRAVRFLKSWGTLQWLPAVFNMLLPLPGFQKVTLVIGFLLREGVCEIEHGCSNAISAMRGSRVSVVCCLVQFWGGLLGFVHERTRKAPLIHYACVKAKAHEIASRVEFHRTRACVWISSADWQSESHHIVTWPSLVQTLKTTRRPGQKAFLHLRLPVCGWIFGSFRTANHGLGRKC